ncbi:MAG TPA: saccharopine dehydrogenase NADP-binding domain-containing protein [Thermoanaerobaculia bacterium]|nr:saccharopine dehydrogenase NADP-binding domain-containing protein [Thermoanaerobaculia bacterium]
MPEWLLYGANGYTGELIARHAVERGLTPVLAGRNAEAVGRLAGELGLAHRAFGLEDMARLEAEIAGFALVLHAAGPFIRTSRPMARACLAKSAHYLDITGEIGVFEALLRLGTKARDAGVVLLPGTGFDVVPSDCLAARLHAALPEAESLELAFWSAGGTWSRGTLRTMIESLPRAGAIRRNGEIVPVPLAWEARQIDFGPGRRWAMTIPWGDVSTAFHTTGIPNVRVYTAMPRAMIRRMRLLRPLLPLAGLGPVKHLLAGWATRKLTGPSAEIRERARMVLWGQATAPDGRHVRATLETPEAYRLTALAAVECTRRVLAGEVPPGAWTPARAFGAGFVATLPGVVEGPLVEHGRG